jgi:hypothetical protein
MTLLDPCRKKSRGTLRTIESFQNRILGYLAIPVTIARYQCQVEGEILIERYVSEEILAERSL